MCCVFSLVNARSGEVVDFIDKTRKLVKPIDSMTILPEAVSESAARLSAPSVSSDARAAATDAVSGDTEASR